MDLGLKGKTAVVTGGASGIGLCTAETLRQEGARLLLADRNAEALDTARGELTARGGEVDTLEVDVRDFDRCRSMAERAVERFGGIDILVNSAGIGGDSAFFADTEPGQWKDLVEINLVGVMNCCRAVVDHMIERRRGKIVSLASEAGRGNEKRIVVYGATKGGVISFTRGLALELGRYSINVNAVCPGVVHSPMTGYLKESEELESRFAAAYPLGRLGVPEDIAPMIAFLCSEQASWITGQAISVNGGFGRA